MSKVIKIGIAAVAVLVLAAGAYWWAALRDTSAPTANLDAMAVSSGSQLPAGGASVDGTWIVKAGPDVFVGYRVNETALPAHTVKTANGRAPGVTGTLTIADNSVTKADLTIDLTKMDSGAGGLREQVLQKIGLETDKYPQATFSLSGPVALPANIAAGTSVSVTLKGTMTAHGVTHELNIPVQAKWDGTEIVAATVGDGAPFVMADWGITVPDLAISDPDDHGTLEAQLRFVKQ